MNDYADTENRDATEGHVDGYYMPGETKEADVVTFPQTSTDRLLDALEEESQAWELSKFTDEQIRKEFNTRFPF